MYIAGVVAIVGHVEVWNIHGRASDGNRVKSRYITFMEVFHSAQHDLLDFLHVAQGDSS